MLLEVLFDLLFVCFVGFSFFFLLESYAAQTGLKPGAGRVMAGPVQWGKLASCAATTPLMSL